MPEHRTYDDRELLRRIAEGDESAFTILFDRFRARIYTIGLKLTHSQHSAEELVQDIFLTIWMRRKDLPNIENIDGYLFSITKNEARRMLRATLIQKDMEVPLSGEDIEGLGTGLEGLVEPKKYENLLAQAVKNLPTQQGKVYRLMREEGYKRDQVAEMLGISPLTVKKNLQVALKSIRAYIYTRIDLGAILLAIWNSVDELVK